MSSLYASRWAATPPAEETSQKQLDSGLFASRWAETPAESEQRKVESSVLTPPWADSPPLVEPVQKDEEGAERLLEDAEERNILPETETDNQVETNNSNENVQSATDEELGSKKLDQDITNGSDVKKNAEKPSSEGRANESLQDQNRETEDVYSTATSPTKSRLEASRLKKKVSWRGKTCVVSIPNLDYNALGLPTPLSFNEIQARLDMFAEAGYDTSGFDVSFEGGAEDDAGQGHVYSKPIFPDEGERRLADDKTGARVRLPDLARWASYMDELTERKLAALGVSTGTEEPLAIPSPKTSRQPSSQYPPLPFSPAISSSSASGLGRPGLVRGHSHTMSVASPISPINSPFGHMHRHSTFSGPINFQQFQNPLKQPELNNARAFQQEQAAVPSPMMRMHSQSPLNQFAVPGLNSVALPTQFAALRNDLPAFRGSGSPLSQQAPGQYTKDNARSLAEDQFGRPNAYSQHVQQAQSPSAVLSNVLPMQPTPSLPQLPEEEEEEEEGEIVEKSGPELEQVPEPTAYVPPHKRAELNADIAVPTPRGHRHNISEGLERDLLESEQRHEADLQNYIEVEEEVSEQTSQSDNSSVRPKAIIEKDPLSEDYPVKETLHSHKRGASRFNVTAPSFKFNPGASFQPAATAFTFGAAPPKPAGQSSASHSRQQSQKVSHSRQPSSGTFNVAAPEFKPAALPSVPRSDFSFSTSGPSFQSAVLPSKHSQVHRLSDRNESTSIFGKVEIPEFVKPARRSKAVAIKKPDESARKVSSSESDVEDAEGRIAQSEDRWKRQRKAGGSGDEIPRFAEPAPIPAPAPGEFVLESRRIEPEEQREASLDILDDAADDSPKTAPKQPDGSVDDAFDHEFDLAYGNRNASGSSAPYHSHKHSASLSALAKPFEPHFSIPKLEPKLDVQESSKDESDLGETDMEEGELKKDALSRISPSRSPARSVASLNRDHEFISTMVGTEQDRRELLDPPFNEGAEAEPSFAEIDAVMRQLNEPDEDQSAQEGASISPLPSPGSHPMPGVTYLPEWTRSDAPSPSPRRRPQPLDSQADSSLTIHDRTDSGERVLDGWPRGNGLNKVAEIPNSDWSADFSVHDDAKLHQRSDVLDSHIDNLIGRVLEKRLQPLEESLRSIHNSVNKRPNSRDLAPKRSSSAVESDADDEDEMSEEQRHRPISRGRDKRIDQIKSAVIEALRERSPQRRSQPSLDMQDFHNYLADMKASFARAASSSLELEDIRGVIEDAVSKQSDALLPVVMDADERNKAHRRQKSELEAHLNQTLAGMLEEANLRRAAEEREAESRRMLQQAEDELRVLRDSSRDDDSKITSVEREKNGLMIRLEQSEETQRDLEDQVKSLEAENAATYATLEEYRMSSSKWRQHIDQATQEREDLDAQLADLRQQLEESKESGSKRRHDFEQAVRERDEFEGTVSSLERQLQESQESGKKHHHDFERAARERDDFGNTVTSLERQLEESQELGKKHRHDFERTTRERGEFENTIRLLELQLEESKESRNKHRHDFERTIRERDEFEGTISSLERQLQESQESGNSMRRRLEKLHADMASAAGQLVSEKSAWKAREEEHQAKCDSLQAQVAAHSASRSQLEQELRPLRVNAGEASEAKSELAQMKNSNSSLTETIRTLQTELAEQQSLVARFERDFNDAKESGRSEVHRVRTSMETDIEAANHQVNVVRAELENELSKVRTELENAKMDTEMAKARYERHIQEEDSAKREVLRKANHASSVALDEARRKHEASLQELQAGHQRSLGHALEDRQRAEIFLNQRLALSDEKLELFQDKVLHLEEKLEVAKSAAQAAAMSAQSRSLPNNVTSTSALPDKVSPQALRESILVLQEQLQDRESLIERLQNQTDSPSPADIKSRDDEIVWLRELLAVRNEELTNLVNALARPTFDRNAVREAAIRIRANLQMEQQEKERSAQGLRSGPVQAIASLSNFATPKAAQLTSAFQKWRSNMESSALKNAPRSNVRPRSNTPSKASAPAIVPSAYMHGLMTPPASNLRTSPVPEATASLPPPRLHSRPGSEASNVTMSGPPKLKNRQPSTTSETSITPLFRSQSYDQDAKDSKDHMQNLEENYEDDNLDGIPDNQPPAFRSLEAELEDAGVDEALA